MQFYTASSLSSSVSAQDVSDPSSSSNISFDQYSSISSDPVVQQAEPARNPIAMAKVFITVNGSQEAASEQASDLIEQSLMRWCSAGRKGNEG